MQSGVDRGGVVGQQAASHLCVSSDLSAKYKTPMSEALTIVWEKALNWNLLFAMLAFAGQGAVEIMWQWNPDSKPGQAVKANLISTPLLLLLMWHDAHTNGMRRWQGVAIREFHAYFPLCLFIFFKCGVDASQAYDIFPSSAQSSIPWMQLIAPVFVWYGKNLLYVDNEKMNDDQKFTKKDLGAAFLTLLLVQAAFAGLMTSEIIGFDDTSSLLKLLGVVLLAGCGTPLLKEGLRTIKCPVAQNCLSCCYLFANSKSNKRSDLEEGSAQLQEVLLEDENAESNQAAVA